MSRPARAPLWAQLFRLDPTGPLTIQAQLRAQIVAAIGAGHLLAEEAMPSSRELAQHLAISRNTVVAAYAQLADDGHLVARQRRGYFINPLAMAARPAVASALPLGPALDWGSRFRVRPSLQRNISKVADWERYEYPFIYGQFDPNLFPSAEWRACCQEVLGKGGARTWAQDLFTRDDPELIEELRNKVLPLRGVWAAADEIIVTIGAQQALYLLADLLFDVDTPVGLENPGYPDARNIFSLRTQRLKALPVDAQGLRIGAGLKSCRYVYVTPSHQAPTTVTMPVDRRIELLRRAERDDFLIIEDDYETETTFSGLPNPALKSLDRAGRVIYVGSLSKSFAPGIRLGYIVAPRPLIDELRALRRLNIRHPSAFIQRSIARFVALGHYDLLCRHLVDAHRERARLLAAAVDEFDLDAAHAPVNGGSSVWFQGPAWLDARVLAEAARAEGILIEPGDVYYMGERPPLNRFRLGYSSIPRGRIREGIRRLAATLERLRPA
ncbi:MAG: PLP-dependent aminotransferase family protein [Pseudomonadota bacterium]